jgi:hypothetical protein
MCFCLIFQWLVSNVHHLQYNRPKGNEKEFQEVQKN